MTVGRHSRHRRPAHGWFNAPALLIYAGVAIVALVVATVRWPAIEGVAVAAIGTIGSTLAAFLTARAISDRDHR